MLTTDINHCARCGEDHPNVELVPLDNHYRYTHFATCPTTKQPIMVTMRDSSTKQPVRD